MPKFRGERPVFRGSKNNLTQGAFGKAKETPEVKLVSFKAYKKAKPVKQPHVRRIDINRLKTSKYTPSSTKPLAKRAGATAEGTVAVRLDAQA